MPTYHLGALRMSLHTHKYTFVVLLEQQVLYATK